MSNCALHPFTEATHVCSACDRHLCAECGTRLDYCGACGGKVIGMGEDAPDHWADSLFDKATERAGDGDVASFLTLHAVVPAAVIAMVYSFLFYLLLVRSIFFGNTGVLQWVGFLFVFAAVLIARYGRTRGDVATQGMYSVLLFGATTLAMYTRSPTVGAWAANVTLLAVVWAYATGATYALSLEGKGEKSTRGAVAPVVGLALFAMVVFAGGEPLMLNAPPEVAIQAILAIITYLMSTGVVLAAASTTSQARRAYRSGGKVALQVMPVRIVAAVVVALVVMSIALALPGVEYSGSGRLQLSPDEILQQRRLTRGTDPTAGALADAFAGGLPWGWLSGFESLTTARGQGRTAFAVVRALQFLGAALLIVILLGAIGWAVSRHSEVGGRLLPWFSRLAAWLRAKLLATVPEWAKPGVRRRRRPLGDPFADLDSLGSRPAREAVMEVYLRSTLLLHTLGYPRPIAATPYDVLGGLPAALGHLTDPLSELTGLYVRAAYSNEEIALHERDGAIAALIAMRERLSAKTEGEG